MKYKCTVRSISTNTRIYDVDTSSAMKAAEWLGRGESGEVVTIYRPRSGKPVSRVCWFPENGGEYYRVWFDPNDPADRLDFSEED